MSDGTKVCKKCGKELPLSEFSISKVVDGKVYLKTKCKKCTAECVHEYYEINKAKIIENKHKYYKENNEKILENKKRYYKDNRDDLLAAHNEYYYDNKEKMSSVHKIYYKNNKDKIVEGVKKYVNTEKGRLVRRKANSKYMRTVAGKQSKCKTDSKRRSLGVNPINDFFEGSHYHHLRHKKDTGEIDNDIGLYIPKALHESIPHNGNTGSNINKINKAALEWYIASVSSKKLTSHIYKLCLYYNVNIK